MNTSRFSPTRLAPALILISALTLILMFTLKTGVAQAQSATAEAAPTYTIDFPANLALADIQLIEKHSARKKGRGSKIKARGRVTLPKNCDLSIDLCYDGPAHMDFIDLFDANQITYFSAAKLELDDQQLTHLQKCKNLAFLNLDGTLVSEKSLPLIGQFSKLINLKLCRTDVTGSGFEALATLHHLTSLNIEGTVLKPGSLAKLKPLAPHLSALNLSRTSLTKVDLPAISELHELIGLDIGGNMQMDNSCIKYLVPLAKLATLSVSDTKITEKSLPDLCQLPKLNILTMRGRQFWISGRPPKTSYRFGFNDESAKTHLPIEMFSPLH